MYAFFEIKFAKIDFHHVNGVVFRALHSCRRKNLRTEADHRVCRDEAKLASHIMAKRQKNISLIELMEGAASIGGDAERGLLETYIEQAFDTPLYSSERRIKEVIEKFGREIYLECRSALDKRFAREQKQPYFSK